MPGAGWDDRALYQERFHRFKEFVAD